MNNSEKIYLVQHEQIAERVSQLRHRSEDVKCRVADTLKKLWFPERVLACINDLQIFQELRTRFPNFSEVIDVLEANAIGLKNLNLPFESSPILMLGEPGLGKTYFASEFARLSKLPYFEINMATTSSSFGLSGGNLQWADGSVGFVAKSLASSDVGNPIFLVDEIDKNYAGQRFSPIAPFYSLLERHTAERFKDEALEIDLNTSKVIWMATANYVENIPEPILSRMNVIDIPRPKGCQMIEIAQSIYADFRRNKAYGKLFDEKLDDGVLEILATFTPREARIQIDNACLKAIRENRFFILTNDISTKKKEKLNVGFI